MIATHEFLRRRKKVLPALSAPNQGWQTSSFHFECIFDHFVAHIWLLDTFFCWNEIWYCDAVFSRTHSDNVEEVGEGSPPPQSLREMSAWSRNRRKFRARLAFSLCLFDALLFKSHFTWTVRNWENESPCVYQISALMVARLRQQLFQASTLRFGDGSGGKLCPLLPPFLFFGHFVRSFGAVAWLLETTKETD